MQTQPRVTPPQGGTGHVIRDSPLGLSPHTVEPLIRLNSAVWHNPVLKPSLLELIRLRNARLVNCVFCKSVRYDVCDASGGSGALVTGALVVTDELGNVQATSPTIDSAGTGCESITTDLTGLALTVDNNTKHYSVVVSLTVPAASESRPAAIRSTSNAALSMAMQRPRIAWPAGVIEKPSGVRFSSFTPRRLSRRATRRPTVT